jgi:hypothetical protein
MQIFKIITIDKEMKFKDQVIDAFMLAVILISRLIK